MTGESPGNAAESGHKPTATNMKEVKMMIIKVVLTSAGFIVVYASGRTRIYSCPYKKLPVRVQQFIDNREKYAESYGDVINAIVWR